MLNDFYRMVPELFGEATCTYNMHPLYHVVSYVRLLGPLSAFCTNSKNGQLKHMYHGIGSVLEQLLLTLILHDTTIVTLSMTQHENMTVMQYFSKFWI